MEINCIKNVDCLLGLKELPDNSVDLILTSPPYDNLRTYCDTCEWNMDVFQSIAKELSRVLKKGGIMVWVVGDAVIDGSETCSSFKQAIYFVDECKLKLHDTMIYEKNSSSFPARITSKRYSQIYEYMFVFCKGKIRDDIKLIADKKNKWAGHTNWGQLTAYDKDGKIVPHKKKINPVPEFSLRTNIWKYSVSFNDKTGHPAVFPEKLAEDCIKSWTADGDIVLDPFMGSGTTAKMAMLNNRKYIGFEKNTDYYLKSLERLEKYKNTPIKSDSDDEIYEDMKVCDRDNEVDEKTKLFEKLVEELNVYFNEQSLGILKTLKLKFETESNTKRVNKILNNIENEE